MKQPKIGDIVRFNCSAHCTHTTDKSIEHVVIGISNLQTVKLHTDPSNEHSKNCLSLVKQAKVQPLERLPKWF